MVDLDGDIGKLRSPSTSSPAKSEYITRHGGDLETGARDNNDIACVD